MAMTEDAGIKAAGALRAAAVKDRALLRIAASSLIIAGTMVGCSGATMGGHADSNAGKVEKMANAQAGEAEKAIAGHDAGRAIISAEAAVAAAPENAAWRTVLGRAYLLGGRYQSAKTAFEDALSLGSTDARTIVNLALIRTALGQGESARDLLDAKIDYLSAADYGLAMAMAGAPDEAVRILSQAIHAPGAGVKERQNLAYAYALSGQWAQARQVAALDLNQQQAAQRVAKWAQTAHAGAESARVVAMIGVAPRGDDAGVPVRLALGGGAKESARLAAADTGPGREDAAQAMIAAASAEEDSAAPLPMPAPSVQQASLLQETPDDGAALPSFPESFPKPRPAVLVAKASPAGRSAARPAVGFGEPSGSRPGEGRGWNPVTADRGSAWVVQLGSFSTRDAAQASRAVFIRQHQNLRAFPMIDSSISLNGRAYYRVAIAGFSDRAGATRFCGVIRARGGDGCFVRMGGAEAAPSRWAAALKAMNMQQAVQRRGA